MNRKTVVAASFLAIAAFHGLPAQPAAADPAFEVATIRPTADDMRGSVLGVTPGNLLMRGYDLSRCLQWAYEMPPSQIEGPDSLRETRFDIVAKAPDAADEARLRLMLRRLVAERFGMKLHRET